MKPGRLQKLGLYIPLKEILVFCSPMLDLSVSDRDLQEQSNFSKMLLLYWMFVSLLLSNLYRGIVVENIVAPSDFEYPVKYDDLKIHSFQIFTTKAYLTYETQYKSAFIEYLLTCMKTEQCPPIGNPTETIDKFQSTIYALSSNRMFTEASVKDSISKFERRILNVYSAYIQHVYVEFMKNNLTLEQADIEGQKLLPDYLYRLTQSMGSKNLSSAFDEIMMCNRTVFVGLKEDLAEIKQRLPARSVKTGQRFYASATHGYEHDIRYGFSDTGSYFSDEKVPRNFRAVFESGSFNAWQDFILRTNYLNFRVQTKREHVAMKLQSGILSFFVSIYVFLSLLFIILLTENIRSTLEGVDWNIVVNKGCNYIRWLYFKYLKFRSKLVLKAIMLVKGTENSHSQ